MCIFSCEFRDGNPNTESKRNAHKGKNIIKLYEKCGFKLIGERKNFYSKPTEDALIYTYYLEE